MPCHTCTRTRTHPHQAQGFGLVELLVCLGVLGLLTTFASPYWARLQARLLLDTAREQLVNDLQSARILALQQGQTLQLASLRTCTWAGSAHSDWSCGWQLSLKSNSQVLRTSALHRPLAVSFSKNDPLDISAQGDLGLVGDRWVLKAQPASLNMATVVCLNSASRLRWQAGESCS